MPFAVNIPQIGGTFYYFLSLFLYSLCVYGGEVPEYQLNSLQAFYDNTNGDNWNWQMNETLYGIPWNFTSIDSNISNPCVSNWQGIGCSANCSTSSVCNITDISLTSFSLAGRLPSQFQELKTLKTIDFTSNALSGTVPTMLAQLTQLSVINLERNSFTGSIPTELVLLSNSLEVLMLNFNDFTDTPIPSQLSQLTMLKTLELGGTCLTGTIPQWLGSLSVLEELGLYELQLTGTIPSYIGLMSTLTAAAFSYNFLYGTVPSTFAQATNLFFFSCRSNSMSGSESVEFLIQMPKMELLLLSGNLFSGNIAVSNVSKALQVLRLDDNMFTGSDVLTSACETMVLTELLANGNLFSGSIPTCVHNWMCLVNLDLSNNRLTGALPDAFWGMPGLESIVLSSNDFRGSLSNIFNSTVLSSVVVSDNGFSGTLPLDLLQLSSLSTFIGSKNCFSGTLSDEICNADYVQTLALSGLTAGSSCISYIPVLNIYEPREFAGTIPSCLFSMPRLNQLYLDGNAIRSKLYGMSDASGLQNLSVSHNRLSGSIPASMQTRQNMHTLDLSFNRLLGTISGMEGFNVSSASTDILLHANHLSGVTPDSFRAAAASIDILAGNLFSCANVNELPQNDPKAKKYSCGSTILYETLYSFVGILGIMGLYAVYVYFRSVDFGPYMNTFRVGVIYLFMGKSSHVSFPETRLPGDDGSVAYLMDQVAVVLGQHRQFCLFIGGLILCVCVPILLVLKGVGGGVYITLTHQYGWWLSLGFIEGATPGVVVATFWLCMLIVSMGYEYSYVNRKTIDFSQMDRKNRLQSTSVEKTAWVLTGVGIVINLILSLVVNGAYVYVVMTQSFALQTVAVWVLVAYKLIWMYIVIVPWLRRIHAKFLLILWVLILNLIVIPMLATMAVDVSCFKSSFSPNPPITTSYVYYVCNGWTGHNECLEYIPVTTSVSFDAPIIYNNQCFASVLTNYVPIYIITYGFIGVAACCTHILTQVFLQKRVSEKDAQVLGLMRRLKAISWFPLRYWLPIESADDLEEEGRHRQNFYRARFHAIHCVLVLTLLLTFGLAYPPLGFVLIVNIVLHTLVFQLSVYNHYKQMEHLPVECLNKWKLVLVDEIRMLHKVIHGSRTALYIFSSGFAAFALYDITSIASSGLAAALILFVVIGTCVGTVVCKQLRVNDISVTRVGRSVSVELSAGIARMRSGSGNSASSKNSDDERVRSSSNMSNTSDEQIQNPLNKDI